MTAEIMHIDDLTACEDVIERAAEVITSGGLVVYPTDTSYGVGCDARDSAAMDRLIAVKRRDPSNGLPLLFSDLSQCQEYHEFDSLELVLARLFWPGALTLVVSPKSDLPYHIKGDRESIATRVPDHVVPRGISQRIGGPIIGTSANKSGGPSPFDMSAALDQLKDEVDLYIDGGPSQSSQNSTIIGVERADDDGFMNIKVYREGALSLDDISKALRIDTEGTRLWSTRLIYADM
ncbi:MAG: L-threonylcarbamoyladenylate synthase [Candidatus Thorarchaeota archaeon]|nr:MAG: threonylcarbamoyl-AMP synthase [Candidatus Thorarchaeota archaeon]RLI59966.1 MAG: threonylcarbamoyl-AMP synthase [Candidatus Thorarchaeota archaeon]